MGGETILGILDAAPWTHEGVHTLILQPQTKVDLLRCWLCGHGYRFLSETLVRDQGAALRRLPCESGNGAGAERSGRADRLIAAVRPAVRRIPVAASYKAQSGRETASPSRRSQIRRRVLRILKISSKRSREEKGSGNMATVHEIEQRLFSWAPRESAMDWDNVAPRRRSRAGRSGATF